MRTVITLIAAAIATAATFAQQAPDHGPASSQLVQLVVFTLAHDTTITDGPEGRDIILHVNREQPVPAEWLSEMRAAITVEDTTGPVTIFVLSGNSDILAAVRKSPSGIITTGNAAIAPRAELPGTGELIPTMPHTVEAGPLPRRSYGPRSSSSGSSSGGSTWGAECTSYQHGDTWGVRCRSW